MFILVCCTQRLPHKLSQGYELNYDRNSYCTIFKDGQTMINGQVIEIGYDSTFIVALVKPIDKIREHINPKHNLNFNEQQILIENSSEREYWIINISLSENLIQNEFGYGLSNVFGPFDKTEYLIKKNETHSSSFIPILWCSIASSTYLN